MPISNKSKFKQSRLVKAIAGVCGGVVLASSSYAAIEEIVVEARRTAENLQSVPISIVALSEESLRDVGFDEIKDLSALSPGLNIEGGVDNNTSRFFIRGVGTATPTFGSEQAVPIYIDDIYTPLGIGSNIDVFSVDRVEVLSGPQGTLYGRNSLGGAVKIYSKQFTNEVEGEVGITIGSFNQRNFKGEFQTPIIEDKLFFGASFATIQNDGIQNNVFTGTRGWEDDKQLYKFRVEGRPNEQLTVKYSFENSESGGAAKQLRSRPGTNGSGSVFIQQSIDSYNAGIADIHALGLAGFGPENFPLLPDATPVADLFSVNFTENDPLASDVDNIFSDLVGDNTVDTSGHTWSINYDINDSLSLKYLGSTFEIDNTRIFDIDGSVEAFFPGFEEFEYESSSHEFRVEYSNDRWDIAAGVYLYEEDQTAFQAFNNVFPSLFGQFGGNGTNLEIVLDNVLAAAQAEIANGNATPDLNALGLPQTPLSVISDPLGQITGLNFLEVRQNLVQNTESTAFYANIGYQVNDKLRLTLGIRNTNDDKFAETPVGNNDAGPVIIVPTSVSPGTGNFEPVGGLGQFFGNNNGVSQLVIDNFLTVNQDQPRVNPPSDPFGFLGNIEADFSETTIEFTADYAINDDSLVYASYKQGFQSGIIIPIDVIDSFVTTAGETVTLDTQPVTTPQQIDAFELGYKTVINNRVRWNSAFYYYDWSDVIIFQPFIVPVGATTFGSLAAPSNNAEATSWGIESDVQFSVNDNLNLWASFAYNNFELDSAQQVNLGTGALVDVTDTFVRDMPAATPELQFRVGGEYFIGLSNGAELRLWSSLAWRDEISTNAQSSFQNAGINLLSQAQVAGGDFIEDSFANLTAGASYTKDNWRVDLSVDNLLDERRVEATVNSAPGSFFGTLETYNKPLTWALTASYSF